MNRVSQYIILGIITSITFLSVIRLSVAESPRERIDYWQKNYHELKPNDDYRAEKAYEIFGRVLNVAGKRLGVVPRLFIIKSNNLLASAIPDGSIILSEKVLDMCYRDSARGDDRLAFVLGHEISHQLKDDFWHMKFFQAIELSKKENDTLHKKVLDEIKDIADSTEKALFKELQADEHGIIYASMAGFNTSAIVNGNNKINFFEEWVQMVDPPRISEIYNEPRHPSPKQRAEVVRARLKQVLDKVELFNLGLIFYQAGDFKKSILAFNEFLKFFPGREVYNNLAISHHQQALKYYHLWKRNEEPLPFKLSMAADSYTKAVDIKLKSGSINLASLFCEHLENAIELYKSAISYDTSYTVSYNNLASALIVKGDEVSIYEAIAKLKKALTIDESFKEALNNLGIAFYYVENPDKAKDYLGRAYMLDTTHNAPLYNLGKIAYLEGKENEARKYWMAYLKLDSSSSWAGVIRQYLSTDKKKIHLNSQEKGEAETVMGLMVGYYDDETPANWGKPVIRVVPLEEEPFRLALYKNGIMTVSHDDEVIMIVTLEGFKGNSSKSISIGSPEKDVLALYGAPSKILNMTQYISLTYTSQGIAFQLREGKVVSWLLY